MNWNWEVCCYTENIFFLDFDLISWGTNYKTILPYVSYNISTIQKK